MAVFCAKKGRIGRFAWAKPCHVPRFSPLSRKNAIRRAGIPYSDRTGGKPYNGVMEPTAPLTLIDYWPLFALGALALFAIIVVFRGLRRPANDTKNRARGGGSTFQGQGGRW